MIQTLNLIMDYFYFRVHRVSPKCVDAAGKSDEVMLNRKKEEEKEQKQTEPLLPNTFKLQNVVPMLNINI